MSKLYLLDTNVLLALVRGGAFGKHLDETFGLTSGKNRSLISVVTHGEVRVLARRNQWGPEKLQALQAALDALVTVDIHVAEVIEAYVEIDLFSQQHPDGARNMGKNDVWIAACAKTAGAALLTTDRDFDHLDPDMLAVHAVDPSAP